MTTSMRQPRLDESFASPASAPSFLYLPANIRHRIYDEAGLPKQCTIDLVHSARRSREVDSPDSQDVPNDPRDYEESQSNGFSVAYDLLQTSRAIYNDIVPLIFSSNTFTIRRRDLGSLEPLLNLSPNSLRSLTHLVIRLNVSSCDIGDECAKSGRFPPSRSRETYDRPIGSVLRSDRAVLLEWQHVAARLATHIQPHCLNLEFTCDTQDYETAEAVVAPFRQLFPPLKSVAIRLCQYPDPALCQLAKETATCSTGGILTNYCSSPFPYTRLPKELQINVLRLSDLITPSDIEWEPRRGFQLRHSPGGCINSSGCFCRRYHAAYSRTCTCWEPPTPLFLVDRAMRRTALDIFYSANRFIIKPRNKTYKSPRLPAGRIEASLFLQELVPTDTINRLRSIEIIFTPFENNYLTSPRYNDWISTISHLAKHATLLPKLTLKIRMTRGVKTRFSRFYRSPLTENQKASVLRMYPRLLTPLDKLQGALRDLFIHLIWPGNRHALSGQETEESWVWREELAEMERVLERRVMGEQYESDARGKDRWR